MSKPLTIQTISDFHSPFHHPDAIDFLKEIKRKYKPDEIVCLGDEVDFHSISKYDSDPDGWSAGDELIRAIDGLRPLYKLFPEMKICWGNHTIRAYKKAFSVGLPKAFIKEVREVFKAPPGWVWADKWVIDGTTFIHGDSFTSNNWHNATQFYSTNVCLGHTHARPGVVYNGNRWTMNSGCLLNHSAYSFSYSKLNKVQPTLGTGIISNGVPQFIPLF